MMIYRRCAVCGGCPCSCGNSCGNSCGCNGTVYLRGATGATGATGPQGPQGPQGEPGADATLPVAANVPLIGNPGEAGAPAIANTVNAIITSLINAGIMATGAAE